MEMKFLALTAAFVAAIPCALGTTTITLYSSPSCLTNSTQITTISGISTSGAECIPVVAAQSVDVTADGCEFIEFFSNADCTGNTLTDVDFDGDGGCQTVAFMPTINSLRINC
jgi:hypothetical protein